MPSEDEWFHDAVLERLATIEKLLERIAEALEPEPMSRSLHSE